MREDVTPPMPDPPRQRRVRRGRLRSRQRLPRLPRRRSFRVPIRHAERLRRRRRSVRWCPAGSRFSSQPAKLVPGKRGTQRGTGDGIEAVLTTHLWFRFRSIQADEDIPSLSVPVNVEHIPRFRARDHHAPLGVCASYLHGGIVPRLARIFNFTPASARGGRRHASTMFRMMNSDRNACTTKIPATAQRTHDRGSTRESMRRFCR